MKILVLTSAHPTDDVRVYTKIVRGFLETGHDVAWYGPEVSFFDDRLDPAVEWHLRPHQPGWRHRLGGLLASAKAAAAARDADWIYTPDPDAAIIALALARLTGARTVFDVHEEFHNGLVRRGVTRPRLANALSCATLWLLRLTSRLSNLTIAVNQTVLDHYAGDNSHRLVVLNSAPRSFARKLPPQPPAGRVRAMHGKAVPTNGSHVVIDALASLAREDAAEVLFITRPRDGARPFAPEVAQRLEAPEVAGKVLVMSGIPHEQMPGVLAGCHLGLIAYGRVLGEASLPNRLFEYLAAGCAVVAPGYSPEIVRILEEHGCGVAVDCEDPRALAVALQQLVHDPARVAAMGRAGWEAFTSHYAWEAQRDQLLAAMERER